MKALIIIYLAIFSICIAVILTAVFDAHSYKHAERKAFRNQMQLLKAQQFLDGTITSREALGLKDD